MRRILWILLVCVTAVACRGCGDQATDNNTEPDAANSDPVACNDLDEDGHFAGADCEEASDCDDLDPDSYEGADEVCGDGADNDCDGDIDDGCEVEGPCVEGATRECGRDEGACELGSQQCTNGEWTECDDVGPVSETCNGLDDDCDGDVDELGIELCDDGLICNGVSRCEDGACTEPEMLDCSELDTPCAEGRCSEKDRGCRAFPLANGTACDDGFFCTENGTCDAGECVTTPRDCSAQEDACNLGVCDEEADACVQQPKSDGTVCDDGSYCTVGDSCTAGVCAGDSRDCSAAADQCNMGICDEMADACVASPVTDGTTCEDGEYCTVSDTCVAGACIGGGQRQCGAVGGSCRDGVCDEATDSCTGDPVPDGTSCDDGRFCTSGDSCVAGTCMGGGATDCSSAAGTCQVGSCNETLNVCVPSPAPDGSSCDDGEFCTINDSCTAGSCGGSTRNCSAASGECTIGVCDEAADACVGQNVSDGTGCPDSLFCTQNEVCLGGTCNRAPRDCSGSGDNCNDGLCDENADACITVPKADDTPCTDGQFCTTDDSCQSGVCTGGPTSCTQFDDVCTVGVCDEDMNTCTGMAEPDGTTCDDGEYCTVMDSCFGGNCTGAQRNCAVASDDCNIGVCDETADTCVPDPTPLEGAACDDGLFCTTPDTCAAGVCGGPARDCSAVEDQCNDSDCSEGSGCVPVPLDGNSCSLSDFCLVNETCDNGTCVGDNRNCDAATGGDPCLDPVCDSGQMMCRAVDNGSCDTCDTSRPTADAGPNQSAVPNETVQLDGTGSTDPMGQTFTYSWRIASRPPGSTSTLSDTTSATPTLLADLSGDFVVCLEVTDIDACISGEDCMTITVAPLVDLHIELTWASDDSDMDLHYQAPNYDQSRWFGTTGVCWFGAPNPDWGGGAAGDQPDGDPTNDPVLDVDNTDGFGPENINQNILFDGTPFTIGVHFWSNTDATLEPFTGPTDARIRVFESGNPIPIFEDTRTLSCHDFWEVAEVTVSGSGTTVNIASKDTLTQRDESANPLCRCNTDSDCIGGDTCRQFRVQGGGPPRFADLCAP